MDCTTCTTEHKEECLAICIGQSTTQRYSVSGDKLLIKTNSTMMCDCCLEYTTDPNNKKLPQLRPVLAGPEWTDPNELI